MVLHNFSHNWAECFLLRWEGITSSNMKVKKECHLSPGLWNFEQVFQRDCIGKKLACERTCPRLTSYVTYIFDTPKFIVTKTMITNMQDLLRHT